MLTLKEKKKRKMLKNQLILQIDGDHCIGPKQNLFKQTTKKVNCPGTVVIRETLRFPNYKVPRLDKELETQ